MLKFVLLLILPCLIVADTQCSGGDISCPEGKTCCTVDDKPACCDAGDLEDKLPLRSVLQYAPSNITIQNGTGCSYPSCYGTCCSSGCCPIQMATFCPNNKCCKFWDTCCGDLCCPSASTCCSNKMCCDYGGTCCGSWCCKSNQRCGISFMTCFNAANVLSPTTLVTLLTMWFAVYVVTKV